MSNPAPKGLLEKVISVRLRRRLVVRFGKQLDSTQRTTRVKSFIVVTLFCFGLRNHQWYESNRLSVEYNHCEFGNNPSKRLRVMVSGSTAPVTPTLVCLILDFENRPIPYGLTPG